MEDISEKIEDLKSKLHRLMDWFDVENKRKRLKELEKQVQNPNLWKNKEKAIKISQELSQLTEELTEFDALKKEIEDLKNETEITAIEKKLKEKEIQVLFLEKYDQGNAILSVHSGAGGLDAQDWATMLIRMYERYSESKGFKTKILDQSFGEGGGPEGRIGTKSATIEIKGKFAYGFLKKENGVHRLVRISPFSTKKLRHTSFALVEVMPEIKQLDEKEIEVKPDNLKIEVFRASGPGGQYVNKRETAVRVKHLPTGIIASCQSERSQANNKKRATELLYSRLYKFYKESKKKEISKIKGDKKSVSWGNQIRSYVLHPYKLVKDLRTKVEVSSVEKVLDGNLDNFIEAEIRLKND
ncbi:MAG TPA: peptide chain release factor 2 [Candidatus Pacearchaeota archaeon]|nr:peptide chain release factor 2 [Candidatus Pacearchaeota archaeon]